MDFLFSLPDNFLDMKKTLACLFILLNGFVYTIQAQTKVESAFGKITFNVKNGTWTLQQFAPNVVKATFKPNGYLTNENISDAVIAKPLNSEIKQWHDGKSSNRSIQWKDFIVEVEGNSISFGPAKTITVTALEPSNTFKGFQFKLHENEKIFGGGERSLPLNRRGYKFNLYNNPWYGYSEGADNLNYSVPFFTSSNGYGLFFDNPSKGYVDIGKTNNNIFEAGFVSGELNVYVILGRDYKKILQSYHKLTGTQPLPPRWAFGNLMSRFGYTSEAQVNEIAAKMKAENIPVDAVIFDLFWFGDSIKGTLGNLDWVNKKAWPNPTKMIGDFKKDGINTILITEPFVLKSTLNYESSKQFHAVDSLGKPFVLTDFYFGQGGVIDLFRNDAQQWFWSKYKAQMNRGVEGWWGDLGEPEKHPSNLFHSLKDLGFKRLFGADEVHNLYGHAWTKMLFNNYAKDYPTKRLFSLNRSGFAGSQRFGIFPWTGDVSRSWSGLRAQLPILLGMSMSGVPYVHSDAGGFAGGEGDNELYIRWLQMAAFTPIFRPHGTALYEVDKNAFSFPSEAALIDTPYRAIAKQIINLRYSLLPYNYTLAYEQAKFGKPLIAPLYYHYPKDTTALNISDEFMWGESILVAPVLQKGIIKRKVYLPEGNWYVTTGQTYKGNQWIEMDVTLKDIPFFYRDGSIIPSHLLSGRTASQLNNRSIYITYVPSSKKSSYSLFSDDGTTKNNLESKNYQLTKITAQQIDDKHIQMSVENTMNNLGNNNESMLVIIHLQKKPKSVLMNGKLYTVINEQTFEGIKTKVSWMSNNTLIINGDYLKELKLSINL
jgi:oligosaccharide 4-alpha-D-glucosyltransferase